MTQRQLRIDKFSFEIEKDLTADPLSAIEVWVFFNSDIASNLLQLPDGMSACSPRHNLRPWH